MNLRRSIVSLRLKILYIFNLKIRRILYSSIISNLEELSWVVNTIASTIPYNNKLEIRIFVHDKYLNVDLHRLKILEYQGDFIRGKNLSHIKLVKLNIMDFMWSDIICQTNIEGSYFSSMFFYKVAILDRVNGSMFVPEFYKMINWDINGRKANNINILQSQTSLNKLLKLHKKSKLAMVIGGGPTLRFYKDIRFSKEEFNISVNDFVIKNMDFFKNSYINAVCFSDSALFFGASKYTQDFYSKLQNAFNYRKFFIIVDIKSYDIVRLNGDFEGYLIGIKRESMDDFKLLSDSNITTSTYPSSNILTSYAMLVALSVADTVIVFGADGIKRNKSQAMNNKNIDSERMLAYQNYNSKQPGFYASYKSALQSHDIYNDYLYSINEFARKYDKSIFTLFKSNYSHLSDLPIDIKKRYIKNV
jgi:hypothetical protein